MEHPSYSPDLVLSDYYMFFPLKGTGLETHPHFFDNGIKKLCLRCEKHVIKADDYAGK